MLAVLASPFRPVRVPERASRSYPVSVFQASIGPSGGHWAETHEPAADIGNWPQAAGIDRRLAGYQTRFPQTVAFYQSPSSPIQEQKPSRIIQHAELPRESTCTRNSAVVAAPIGPRSVKVLGITTLTHDIVDFSTGVGKLLRSDKLKNSTDLPRIVPQDEPASDHWPSNKKTSWNSKLAKQSLCAPTAQRLDG